MIEKLVWHCKKGSGLLSLSSFPPCFPSSFPSTIELSLPHPLCLLSPPSVPSHSVHVRGSTVLSFRRRQREHLLFKAIARQWEIRENSSLLYPRFRVCYHAISCAGLCVLDGVVWAARDHFTGLFCGFISLGKMQECTVFGIGKCYVCSLIVSYWYINILSTYIHNLYINNICMYMCALIFHWCGWLPFHRCVCVSLYSYSSIYWMCLCVHVNLQIFWRCAIRSRPDLRQTLYYDTIPLQPSLPMVWRWWNVPGKTWDIVKVFTQICIV